MVSRVEILVDQLVARSRVELGKNGVDRQCHWLTDATELEVVALLDLFCQQLDATPGVVQAEFVRVIRCLIERQHVRDALIGTRLRESISQLYARLGSVDVPRWLLLHWLALSGGRGDLAELVERIVADPPGDGRAVGLTLAPLFQSENWDISAVFPRLLDAMAHPMLAATVLDLANYITRRGRVPTHPAAGHLDALVRLLGALVQRLAQFAEKTVDGLPERQEMGRQVDAGVAVVIALCDALALIGDRRAVGKLYQALELRHRRLRAEAAAALARLNEAEGTDVLVAMAAEPITRLRVLADAKALGVLDRIDPQFATAEARAEAEVALALAQPTCFGLPPQSIEHFHRQTLYWPGHEQPVVCHLVRYSYVLAGGRYANIALCGPVTHVLTADLNDLPPDDIFAVYAGWHAEHEEIHAMNADQWTPAQAATAELRARQLTGAGYADIQPIMLGAMFGDWALIAHAVRDGVPGLAVTDGQQVDFQPDQPNAHPLGPTEVYWRYTGRRILRQFNPDYS